MEEVFPEVVLTDEKGYKSVEYGKLVAPLIEAIKEQQAQIERLKTENETLRVNISELKEQVDALFRLSMH